MPAMDADVEMEDVGDHELPEQDAAVCSRNCYQRFLTRYRRWVETQVADQEDEPQQEALRKRLTLAYKTPEQKKRLAKLFWQNCPQGTTEEDRTAILALWDQKKAKSGKVGQMVSRSSCALDL